jgi:hypothetical protein
MSETILLVVRHRNSIVIVNLHHMPRIPVHMLHDPWPGESNPEKLFVRFDSQAVGREGAASERLNVECSENRSHRVGCHGGGAAILLGEGKE